MRVFPGLGLALMLLAACAISGGQEPAPASAAPEAAPQRAAPQIAFGKRGELIIDGKPRFIRGGYRSGQEDRFAEALRSAADAGFDLVHDYRFESFDVERQGVKQFITDARAYLRKADQLGLGVFLGLPRKAVSSADEKNITAIVKALANEHALWFWYIYDEPSEQELPLASAEKVYALLRRLDPQRPSVILANTPGTLTQYLPFCDLIWSNRYPIAATSPEKSSLRPLADTVRTNMKAAQGRKPLWSVVQGQDNKGSPKLRARRPGLPKPDDRNHRPNAAELRAAAHIAIASGSMAVVYYWAPEDWYSMKRDTPGIWASLGKVVHELGELEPVLLSPAAPRVLQTVKTDDRVMTWTRSHAGKVYVGLVNAEINAPAQVTFRSPDATGEFTPVSGNGDLARGKGGEVSVRLGPAGVLVIAADAQASPATGRR
jgi:hypothetical protein